MVLHIRCDRGVRPMVTANWIMTAHVPGLKKVAADRENCITRDNMSGICALGNSKTFAWS